MSSSTVSLNLVMRNPDEDHKLVEETLRGNRNAFKELFMKNVNRVNSLCLKISSDIHIAEELTQEVFIKAWEKLDTFKFECKFSTWLHSIAVNLFLMKVRSDKRDSDKIESYARENPGNNKSSNDLKQDQKQDLKMDLQKAIDNLPVQAKTVLVLHDIEGYKHNEIAEMMSIQTGTSKAHLHRARRILREELSK